MCQLKLQADRLWGLKAYPGALHCTISSLVAQPDTAEQANNIIFIAGPE